MSESIMGTQEWIQCNAEYFKTAAELAGEIGVQNETYGKFTDPDTVSTEEFRNVVAGHLAELQAVKFAELVEIGGIAPYEELPDRERVLYGARAEASEELGTFNQRGPVAVPGVQRLEAEAAMVLQELPELASELGSVAERLQEEAVANERLRLEGRQRKLNEEYKAILELYEVAGAPWPIPRIPVPEATTQGEAVIAEETDGDSELQDSSETIARRNPEPRWGAAFRQLVSETIEAFERDNLMFEGPVTPRYMRRVSSSGIMGTEEMITRAQRHGIITADDAHPDTALPTYVYVCMALQNRVVRQGYFTEKSKRDKAIPIVKQMVEEYFAEKEQAESKSSA